MWLVLEIKCQINRLRMITGRNKPRQLDKKVMVIDSDFNRIFLFNHLFDEIRWDGTAMESHPIKSSGLQIEKILHILKPFSWLLNSEKFKWKVALPNIQKFVDNNGKHTACGEQYELTMHTEVFDAQVYVRLLHGSKSNIDCPVHNICYYWVYDSQSKMLMTRDNCCYYLSLNGIVLKNRLMLIAIQNEVTKTM